MTDKPTHLVSFYGLRCYFDEHTDALWATRAWLEWLVPVLCHLHNAAVTVTCVCCPSFEPKGFPVRLIRTLCVILCLCGMSSQALADSIPRQALTHRALLTREARAGWGLNAPVATFAGQIHQESLWRADAVSHAGAQGLAQFMPATAQWLPEVAPQTGKPLPFSPAWSMRAMIVYDRWLWNRVQAVLDCDRWAFTLAAYNGGLGWVRKDQRFAAEKGLDPLRWDDVAQVNAGRSVMNFKENRGYPARILGRWTELYRAAGWGTGGCDAR